MTISSRQKKTCGTTTKHTKSNRTKPELREKSFTVGWRRKEVLTVLSSLHILLDCCRQPCLPQQNSEEESESWRNRESPSSFLTTHFLQRRSIWKPRWSASKRIISFQTLSLSLVSASSASQTAFLTPPGTENKVFSDYRSRPRIGVHDSEFRTSSRNR